MSSHKRSYNTTKKEVHWESLLGNMSSLKRSYNATNKQAHSQYLYTNMSSVKRSYCASNSQVLLKYPFTYMFTVKLISEFIDNTFWNICLLSREVIMKIKSNFIQHTFQKHIIC